MSKPEFAPWGVWLDKPDDYLPRLETDTEADVVIVGAGYTGLSAALALREAGADVAVVEKNFVGAGASGCNAGFVDGAMGNDFNLLNLLLGKERTSAFASFCDVAVEYLDDRIDTLGIDCDYDRKGSYVAGVHPGQREALQQRAEVTRSYGSNVRFVPVEEMRERGMPAEFHDGIHQQFGGMLDPAKLVRGLRDAALAAGARVYEGSEVTAIEDGAKAVVRTTEGTVRAPWVILATNAYTPDLGRARRLVLPFRVSGVETAPLTADQRERLGWPSGVGAITAHVLLESMRLTPSGTLQFSTRKVSAGFAGNRPQANVPKRFEFLSRALYNRFPQLRDVEIARTWSGYIAMTAQYAPVFGTEGRNDNILYGLGYCGHGLATSVLMGRILAGHALGKPHELAHVVQRKAWRLPPEPFCWSGASLVLNAMELGNKFVDRRARRAAA